MKHLLFLLSIICVSLTTITNAAVVYVKINATGLNDGTSWVNGYSTLQQALTTAISGDEIWVAAGTYYPSSAYDLTNTSRYYHFRMKNEVAIYGGFSGNETAVSQRSDFGAGKTNETILSGDIGTTGDKSDNCYHLFYHPDGCTLTSSSVLDGFTICNGNANGSDPYNLGGGICDLSYTSNPTLKNLTISNNNALAHGGGVHLKNSSPELINVLITNNIAGGNAGGIYMASNSPTFTNVTITKNSALFGGGLSSAYGSPTFNNCIIWGNTANIFDELFKEIVESGVITLNYSCYNPGISAEFITANNCNTNDPFFVDAVNGDFRVFGISPAVDAGNDAYNTQANDIRGAGYGRKLNKIDGTAGSIDMGAFEYRFGIDPYGLCINPGSGGAIAADQNGCSPFDPDLITSVALPAGYNGTIKYKWQQSVTSSSTGFADIADSDAATFDPGLISATTWYKRLAMVDCKIDDWTDAAGSNVVEVTVRPRPAPAITGSASVDPGEAEVVYTTEPSMTDYTWTVSSGGEITGETGTNAISVRWNISGAQTISVNYTNVNSCMAILPTVYNITVNPIPTVNQPGNQTLCNNDATEAVVFSGSMTTTIYNWTNSNSSIGLAASGTGDIASFTTTNLTNAPVTATIIVTPVSTPELLYYKFDGTGTSVPNLASIPPVGTTTATIVGGLTQGGTGICNGTLVGTVGNSINDYVNTGWVTNLTGTSWTLTFKTSNISPSGTLYYILGDVSAGNLRCFTNGVAGPNNWILRGPVNDVLLPGGATMAPHTNTFVYDKVSGNIKAYLDGVLVNTVSQLPVTISGTGPFTIGAYGGSVTTGLNSGGLLDEFSLYNHALSLAEVQDLTTCNNAKNFTGSPKTFTITSNPTPTVNAVENQTLCSGVNATAIPFSGAVAGTVYNWVNNDVTIGLAASGSGDIPAFSAINTGTTPVTAMIIVTPSFTNEGESCTGTPMTFNISVTPLIDPVIAGPASACVTSEGNGYSTAAGMTGYAWTISPGGIITAGDGTNSITVTWETAGVQQVSVNYSNADGCMAALASVYDVTIIPLPVPVITGPASVCVTSEDNSYSTVAGMTGYTWTISSGGVITAGDGTNSITVTWETAGVQQVSVNYSNADGCMAALASVYDVTIIPLPVPVITGPASVCVTSEDNGYSTASGMTGYAWTISSGGVITAGDGTNSIIVTWNSAGAQSVSVNYTSDNNCMATSPTIYNITVSPLLTVNQPESQGLCNNAATGEVIFSGTMANTDYNWTNNNPSIGLAASGTGDIESFTATNSGIEPVEAIVTVTPLNGGCIGTPKSFTYTVFPNIAASVSIAASANPVCFGTPVIFTAIPENGGTPTYQWKLNGTDAGTESTYTNAALANNDQVICIITSTTTCTSGSTASSNGITMTVTPSPIEVVATSGNPGPVNYPNLKAAFDKINDGTHQGDINIKLLYNTTETATAILYQSGYDNTSGYTSVNIYPAATNLSISGDLAAPLIDLNGADNVTINGSLNGLNTGKDLTIINTSYSGFAGTSTIRFIHDASDNTVKYCNVKGSSMDDSAGILFFNTGTTTGNDNNLIDFNSITTADDSNRPINAVYSRGTVGAGRENSTNAISNNNVYNFTNRANKLGSAIANGVSLSSGNTGWEISGNSFYETSGFIPAEDASVYIQCINIENKKENDVVITISGNFIGGSGEGCKGTWVNAGGNVTFTGISLNAGTGQASSLQGNVIRNFDFKSDSDSPWNGIFILSGNVNIGTVTGNIIGDITGTGSITVNALNGGFSGAVYLYGGGNVSFENNKIGSLKLSGNSTHYHHFRAIAGDANMIIRNNQIGSIDTPNSIHCYSPEFVGNQNLIGIITQTSESSIISGNIISNLNNEVSVLNTNNDVNLVGIANLSYGACSITRNQISNLYTNGGSPGEQGMASILGILAGSEQTQIISHNSITGLQNTNPDQQVSISALSLLEVTASADTVSGNFIEGLKLSSSNESSYATGITISDYGDSGKRSSAGRSIKATDRLFFGNPLVNSLITAKTAKVSIDAYEVGLGNIISNNIITLGSGLSNSCRITGISEGLSIDANHIYFNTVNIGGIATSGVSDSYALYSANQISDRDIRNNILVNSRSNSGGSGVNYAAYFEDAVYFKYADKPSPEALLTLGYNNYYTPGTGGVLGYFNGADQNALPLVTGQDANSLNMDPGFADAGGTVATDYLPSLITLNAVTGTDVTTDYALTTRSLVYPAMGAYEYDVSPCSNPIFGGTIGSAQTICSSSTPATFTSIASPSGQTRMLVYKWQLSTDGSSSGFTDIPSSNSADYTSGSLSLTTWYKRLAIVACKIDDWSAAAESNVVKLTVNALPAAPAPGNISYTYTGTANTASANVGTGETVDWYLNSSGGSTIFAPSGINAGTYYAYAEARNTTTGCVSVNRTLITLEITKKALTITADDNSKAYGAALPELKASYAGLVNGDVAPATLPAISTTALTTSAFGTYPIIATGAADPNYAISYTAGTLTVNKVALTITAENKSKCYDGKVYSGGNTVTYDGFVNGNDPGVLSGTLTFSGTALSATTAGSYAIMPEGLSSENYVIAYVNGTLVLNSVPVPAVAGLTAVCEGTTGVSYTTEAAMAGYVWNVSTGGIIAAGAETNSITVNWNSAGARTVAVNYVNSNGCTGISNAVRNVTINPTPGDAGSITGNVAIGGGSQGVVYSIPAISNADTYVWTLPAGATIGSGDGTPTILVNFAADASSGNISVYGKNTCSNGKASGLPISVTLIPAAAGNIKGEHTFAAGTYTAIYSVDPIDNATKYVWILPPGGNIISGLNTNTITVNFSLNCVGGNISVYGSNSFNSGAVSPNFEITMIKAQFTIYPVPSDGLFTVSIASPVEAIYSIRVYNQLGDIILVINDAVTVNGKYNRVINLRPIPAGIYYVEFFNGMYKEVRKLLVNK